MSKYCYIVLSTIEGVESYRLICSDDALCDFFDQWSHQLAIKYSFNTVKGYSYSVSTYLNYLFVLADIHNGMTSLLILRATEAYESYLTFGSSSNSELAVKAANTIKPKKGMSASSIESNFAAINNFIEASDNYLTSLKLLEENNILNSSIAAVAPLFTHETINAPEHIRNKIKQNSWLASCLAGGVKKIKKKSLKSKIRSPSVIYSGVDGGDEKTFPYDKAVELLNAANNSRDKLLWALEASIGCRPIEALSILIDDINLDTREIYIIPPKERPEILSKYLSEKEYRRLSHKGRSTNKTYMIRPFDLIFWETLVIYMDDWYKKGVHHRFLFQKSNGEPYVGSYHSALEAFQKAAVKVTGYKYGPHSLRHMYGYYLKNWIPNEKGGWGFPLATVRDCMGHSALESTKRYARDDVIKLEAIIRYAQGLQDQEGAILVKNKKIAFLKKEIERIEGSIQIPNKPEDKN